MLLLPRGRASFDILQFDLESQRSLLLCKGGCVLESFETPTKVARLITAFASEYVNLI
jgi:hypothetical protein